MNPLEKGQKVTIYTTSEFFGSIQKYEGTLIEHGRRKYAQYDDAPFVDFIPKGKRKGVRLLKAYKPYLLICLGWKCPNAQEMFGLEKVSEYPEGKVFIRESRYQSFDSGYKKDFDLVIDNMITRGDVVILADYRDRSYQEV